MDRGLNISVAMAVYNGEKYIREQIESIISQLEKNDELIISYNESIDNTFNIIKEYECTNKNITVVVGKETGVICNFNNAIKNTNNSVIVLADQDDVWEKNKIASIKAFFQSHDCLLLVHNCSYIDKNGLPLEGDLFSYRNAGVGFFKNLLKNSYQGCCMAFKRELLEYIFPIPNNVTMHDQWIGLLAEKLNASFFSNNLLIRYRRRNDNISGKRVPILQKITKMMQMFLLVEIRYFKINRKNNI